jgi:hypothetical protein
MTPQKNILLDRIYVGCDTTLYNRSGVIHILACKGERRRLLLPHSFGDSVIVL